MTKQRVARANRNQKLRARSWVYFAQESATALVKIGQSRQVHRRICVLNSATAGGVKLIGLLPETDVTERSVHNLMSEHRERGEWFRPHDDVTRLAGAGLAIYANGYRGEIPDEFHDEMMIIHCAKMGVLPTSFLRELEIARLQEQPT